MLILTERVGDRLSALSANVVTPQGEIDALGVVCNCKGNLLSAWGMNCWALAMKAIPSSPMSRENKSREESSGSSLLSDSIALFRSSDMFPGKRESYFGGCRWRSDTVHLHEVQRMHWKGGGSAPLARS